MILVLGLLVNNLVHKLAFLLRVLLVPKQLRDAVQYEVHELDVHGGVEHFGEGVLLEVVFLLFGLQSL